MLVQALELALDAGERLTLVGPNGSGKTTLLRVLAGLEPPAAGQVERPQDPPGMHFQDGGLWPHMTVAQHLAFVDTRGDREWRTRLLETFDLTALTERRPESLSGGEQARLGLARALAGRPRWVLLDEPLAHLDPAVRDEVRATLPVALDDLGAAAIVVTHQVDDVLLFGARLLCLTGDGGWWDGPAQVAISSPPNAALAAWSERGTLLSGRADAEGHVDFGFGLACDDVAPGRRIKALLDAHAVRFGAPDAPGLMGTLVAPDQRGGTWVRINGRLVRSAETMGSRRPGCSVPVKIEGAVRILDDGPGASPTR